MKKYLAGIIAIVMAIGFSAFTSSTKPSSTEDLYWYPVEGMVTTGPYVTHSSEEEAKNEFCPDTPNQPVCLFGSEDDDLPTNTSVSGISNENLLIREREN